MLTKKDLKAVAEIISSTTLTTMRSSNETIQEASMAQRACMRAGVEATTSRISQKLADYFTTQNSHFDRSQFMKACGLD